MAVVLPLVNAVNEFVLGKIGLVIGRVGAHDVDHCRVGPPRVVKVRETVGEAAAHMQKRERGFARHARVAVRRAGHHVLFHRTGRTFSVRPIS